MDVKKIDILIVVGLIGLFSNIVTNYTIYQHSLNSARQHTYSEEMAETRKLELEAKIMKKLNDIEDVCRDD